MVYKNLQSNLASILNFTKFFSASGSCSHVIGFIIALQQWQLMGFTEVPSKLSCTSLPEQWSKPRCTKVEAGDVPHLVFVNPKPDRKKKPVTNTLTECRYLIYTGLFHELCFPYFAQSKQMYT